MKIFLIRHGETTGDVEDRYGGAYDDRLTEKGRQQIRQTAEQLKGRQINMVFVSSLIRARESADIINEQLHTKIKVMDGLRERSYGVLGGLTKAEALERYPEAVEAHKDPVNTDPEGESQTDFSGRVLSALAAIKESGHDIVAVVSHGGPIKVIMSHLHMPLPDSIGDGEVIEVDL